MKSKAAILIESLLAPSFEEFAELVFRDYDRKYNKWMNSGSKPPQPALEPVLKSAYKKYIGYNSPEFKYTYPEVVDKYKQYRKEELEDQYRHKDSNKKAKAIEMGLAHFGISTLK